MRTLLRQLSLMTSRPNSWWLTFMLLLAVLVPSVCLFWFMNQAVQNEKLAARQELMEAYRGNLSLAQSRLGGWRAQLMRDAETNHLPAPEFFAATVRAGMADAVICYDSGSRVVYPAPERASHADAAALALQARARDLNKAGRKQETIALILDAVAQGRMTDAVDGEGRLIMPGLELMALELAPTNAPLLLTGLQTALNDYKNAMPAPQRRFLMRRCADLFPKQPVFATLGAEDLAARYLDSGPPPPREARLKAAALPGLWQMASSDGRVLMLFQSQTVQRHLLEVAASQIFPSAVNLTLVMPGAEPTNYLQTVPAGEDFPGWQLALALKDRSIFDAAANEQIASYVWIGVLTMSAVIILVLLGTGLIRRQAAVAKLRNDLLANVTHELKTPLSSMRLLVDTLLQSNPICEETARQYLQLIATENVRLSRLIDNFLTFSRIERKKHVFDFTEVAAAAIAERAAAAVRERFAAAGCRFELQTPAVLPRVVADADAMITVLLNLLDNAWKYSGDEKHITLSAAAENGNVMFAVADNGIGLAPRETKRIFRRFYQVDQRLARPGGGCGLGLSIVQYIVTAHHGTIRVESELGRGSTFIVTLPAAPEAAI
jgi:signal transduction histidine kinase